jgi:predicted ATPase
MQELRERLPQATFMVTSRALLHLPGEREFSVMPLPTPLESAQADALNDYPSAALFCDRAHLALTPTNSAAIGALCRRLDGIPQANHRRNVEAETGKHFRARAGSDSGDMKDAVK